MKTVGGPQMPVRYDRHSGFVSFTGLDRPGEYNGGGPAVATRPAPPTAEGLTL